MPHTRIVTNYDMGPEGNILIVTLDDDPAAGQEMTVTVPGRAIWEIMALRFRFLASATVASRAVNLEIDDGETAFVVITRALLQTASQDFTYGYFPGANEDFASAVSVQNVFPAHLTMLPGWRIRTNTGGLQASDNYDAPIVYVREVPQRGLAVGQDALLSALRRLIGEEGLRG